MEMFHGSSITGEKSLEFFFFFGFAILYLFHKALDLTWPHMLPSKRAICGLQCCFKLKLVFLEVSRQRS